MTTTWIQHVKQYQNEHDCSYREALSKAKQTYTGGSLKSSGYIKRLIKEDKINIDKIKNPSTYILARYGKKQPAPVEPPVPEPIYDDPAPIFDDPEPQYDDHHDPQLRAMKKAKRKPLTKKQREEIQREEQEERERAERAELIAKYTQMKESIPKLKTSLSKLDDDFKKEYAGISKAKNIRKAVKETMHDTLHRTLNTKVNELKKEYKHVYHFMKSNKLKDLEATYKKLRSLIQLRH
jgi:type IV secretory pathway VirB10-like protein